MTSVSSITCRTILLFQVPFLILILTAVYICLGALVFCHLEMMPNNSSLRANNINTSFGEDYKEDEWSFGSSVLLTFSIVTTIGYGNIAPATLPGRVFCIFYALFGIPMGMLGLANIGRIFNKLAVQAITYCRNLCISLYDKDELQVNRYKSSSGQLHPLALLSLFVIWIFFGALILPNWEHMTHTEALWFSFISLTTIGFGDYYPRNYPYFALTYIYIMFGLVFTSMAIDILSNYLRKLEYLGRKLTNLGDTKLWFGSNSIGTKELFKGVMSQLPIETPVIKQALEQLDELILNTLAGNVGDAPKVQCEAPPPKIIIDPVLKAFANIDIDFMDDGDDDDDDDVDNKKQAIERSNRPKDEPKDPPAKNLESGAEGKRYPSLYTIAQVIAHTSVSRGLKDNTASTSGDEGTTSTHFTDESSKHNSGGSR